MKKSIALVLSLAAAACGDDGGNNPMIDAGPGSDGSGSGSDGGPQPVTYVQIEQLARPGIAEALLLSNGYLAGYNATAPTFTGVPAATLGDVVAEAKTVLKAIYLGTCLVNGIATLNATNGAHPGGTTCAAVGGALFTEGTAAGVTLTQAAKDGAQAYADRVFSQFVPDVMRIDTAGASGYFQGGAALCNGAAANSPLLCGGRLLDDDVIDVTYFYLLAGGAVPAGLAGNVPQALALVNDGVSFAGAANNPNQGHPAVSTTFPYSAAPL